MQDGECGQCTQVVNISRWSVSTSGQHIEGGQQIEVVNMHTLQLTYSSGQQT